MGFYAAETSRLWLQLLSVDDHLDDYHKIMTEPECLAWSKRSVHTSLEETRQLIYISTPTDIDPWKRVYAILLRPEASKQSSDSTTPTESEKPRMIGVLGTPHELELSYKLHPDFWGRGYMSEALKAFINLFWEENITAGYLRAFADPENNGSVRVLHKAGFKDTITLEAQYIRSKDQKSGKRSAFKVFWLGRPGTSESPDDRSLHPRLGVNDEIHDELKKSIKDMFYQ